MSDAPVTRITQLGTPPWGATVSLALDQPIGGPLRQLPGMSYPTLGVGSYRARIYLQFSQGDLNSSFLFALQPPTTGVTVSTSRTTGWIIPNAAGVLAQNTLIRNIILANALPGTAQFSIFGDGVANSLGAIIITVSFVVIIPGLLALMAGIAGPGAGTVWAGTTVEWSRV